MTLNDQPLHVVKLGGSLLGLPELVPRFEAWRSAQADALVLVVGGGAAADVVRTWDRAFKLDESAAHWLAIRAMQLNAHLIAAVVPNCEVVAKPQAVEETLVRGKLPLIDPLAWLEREAVEGIHIPHRWTFTSDSIAAHVAVQFKARRLTLLKSALPPGDCGPVCAAGLGIVDEDFPDACAAIPSVELINLRVTPPARCVLR